MFISQPLILKSSQNPCDQVTLEPFIRWSSNLFAAQDLRKWEKKSHTEELSHLLQQQVGSMNANVFWLVFCHHSLRNLWQKSSKKQHIRDNFSSMLMTKNKQISKVLFMYLLFSSPSLSILSPTFILSWLVLAFFFKLPSCCVPRICEFKAKATSKLFFFLKMQWVRGTVYPISVFGLSGCLRSKTTRKIHW